MTRDTQWRDCCKLIGTSATLTRIAIEEERTRSKPPDSWLDAFLRVCRASWHVAALEHPPEDVNQQLVRSEVLEAYLQMRGLYPTEAATIWVNVRRFAWFTISVVKDVAERPGTYRYILRDLDRRSRETGFFNTVTKNHIEYAEKIWPFVAVAGRLPKHPDDDVLLEAFEAAMLADAYDFATHLARHGFGIGP